MSMTYLAKYQDKFGTESITISNNSKNLKLTLRGVEFTSHNFYSFSILPDVSDAQRSLFNLFVDDLCDYSIDCEIPISLVIGSKEIPAILHAHIEYGEPVDGHTKFHYSDGKEFEVNQQINVEILKLGIEYDGEIYTSNGKNNYNTFDEQLIELRKNLPSDVYLKTCWNCAFSDYHPVGSGIFGDLACFRNIKNEYRQVKDKRALMHLWSKRTENVQEIYLCTEFEKRQPGIGGLYVG